jgi:hypothetical protein
MKSIKHENNIVILLKLNRFAQSIVFISALLCLSCGNDDNPVSPTDDRFAVQSVFVGFTNHYLDLDSGLIDTLVGPGIPSGLTDLRNAFNGFRDIHSTIVIQAGRKIVYMGDFTFSEITAEDINTVTFTELQIDIQFDSVTVFLFETDLGAIYKLGNPVENFDGVRFDYQLLLEPEIP